MARLTVITGAAGFIGRNTVKTLNDRGHRDLLLVDTLGMDHKWKHLMGLSYEDILSPQEFLTHLQANRLPLLDGIIHLGACSATTEKNADFLLENNYRYTRALCEWAVGHKVRFIYASSGQTYGDGTLGYSDDDAVTPTLRQLTMYGYSKHMFDLWALRHDLFKQIVGLKYFNVYGPYEDHKGDMRSVVFKAYHQILQTGEVTLFKSYHPDYADGAQKRDFIYVKDAVDVTLSFLGFAGPSNAAAGIPVANTLGADGAGRGVGGGNAGGGGAGNGGGGLFNCGTGQARTWLDLVQAVFAAMGREMKVRFIDMPDALRHSYQYFTQADMHKLRRAGYDRPFMSLEDGVRDYVTGYLAQEK